MERCILHVDMDAFFASVEQLDNPELREKPVIIGRDPRGVVSAASYEARAFGVRSAMPVARARKLCPHGRFLPGRMHRYVELSRLVMAQLDAFSPLVEQASVDEAWLDITGSERLFGPPRALGMALKAKVLEATGLKCSVGIAPMKFLAKIASDMDKPDGLYIIEPDWVRPFLDELPVGKIPGVGGRTLESLRLLGVETAGDMLKQPDDFWERRLGKHGRDLLLRAKGLDDSPVRTGRERKSVGAENTFPRDIAGLEDLKKWLLLQSERVGASLRAKNKAGRTVTLKLKFSDFKQITRSRTLSEPTNVDEVIFDTARALLEARPPSKRVRLIGVSVSNFSGGETQCSLFDRNDGRDAERWERLDRAIDAIRGKYDRDAVKRGRIFDFSPKNRKE